MAALLKKQSAAKPPDAVFFVDRSLGIEPLRSILRKAGVRVEIHDDHFKRDEEDQVWLVEATRAGPFIARISKNARISIS